MHLYNLYIFLISNMDDYIDIDTHIVRIKPIHFTTCRATISRTCARTRGTSCDVSSFDLFLVLECNREAPLSTAVQRENALHVF